MEREPDTENVVYLDEYPHLAEVVRLRRAEQMALFSVEELNGNIALFKLPEETPDGAA